MNIIPKHEHSILIVDDNSANLELLREILSKEGYFIKLARSGKEALLQISEKSPSLIILDVMMPGMDGFDLCSRIKNNAETKKIPVIFISALEDDESKIKGLQAGAIDFISKPFIHKEVTVRVKNHLEIRNMQIELEEINNQLKAEIYDRQIAEKLLNESNEKFSKVFSVSPYVQIITSIEDGKIIEVNDAIYTIGGYTRTEAIGKTTFELSFWLNVATRSEFIKKLSTEGTVLNYEISLRRKNGEIFDALVSGDFITIDEKKCIFSIIHDISNRINTEKALEESRKNLMALNTTKDKLFSIIAHDLKSPFNSIMGFSELLKKNIHTLDTGKIEEYLDHIYDSSKKTFILIDNLLIWAKAQAGKIEYKPQPTDIEKIFQEITTETESQGRIKNISVSYFQSEKIIIHADINMIKTILRNLIVNAIKFTRPGGKINLFALTRENMAEITVSDNGIGMNPEIAQGLFKSNIHESTTGTANEKGSGLGLQICMEFVERHGGKIWAESEPGLGTEIKFLIPQSQKK